MAEKIKITLINTLDDRQLTLRRLDEIVYTDDCKLRLEKYSVGSALSDFYGDSDYEKDIEVPADEVPKVLMALIGERFRDLSNFQLWLHDHKIKTTGFMF